MTRYARQLAWGTSVVAAILLLAAFGALFRHDLGDPLRAAAVFGGIAVAVWLAGRAIVYFSGRAAGR